MSHNTLKSWGGLGLVEEGEELRFQEPSHYVMGRTMIFIKAPETLHTLEEVRKC